MTATTSKAWRLSTDAMRLLDAAAHLHQGDRTDKAEHRRELEETSAAWPELVAAGMATAPGEIDPAWAELVSEAAKGDLAWRVVARQGASGAAADLSVLPTVGLCLAERRKLRVSPDEIEVVATEDAVTVAIFEPQDLWDTIVRFIPPHPALRAPSGPDSPRDEELVGRITPDRAVMPPEVLEQLAAADVELSIALHVDRGEHRAVVAQRHWAVSGDELLEVRLGPGRVDVVSCPPGTVASEVLWMGAGAMDLRAGVMEVQS